jgi:tellurite methyltransferase
MNKPFWEDTYRDQNVNTFGEPSKEIIELADKMPKNSIVLDIGCGDGRNTLFLAQKGFKVDAFDISENGINKLKSLAKREKVTINAWVQDIAQYKFDKEYDFIVSHGVFHLLEREKWMKSIKDVKNNTAINGVNVIVVFTDKIPPPSDLEPFINGLFHEGEIKNLYNDWEIDLFESIVFEDEHPGNIKHVHALNKIVARKINNADKKTTK